MAATTVFELNRPAIALCGEGFQDPRLHIELVTLYIRPSGAQITHVKDICVAQLSCIYELEMAALRRQDRAKLYCTNEVKYIADKKI
jgi:hypothetical protein